MNVTYPDSYFNISTFIKNVPKCYFKQSEKHYTDLRFLSHGTCFTRHAHEFIIDRALCCIGYRVLTWSWSDDTPSCQSWSVVSLSKNLYPNCSVPGTDSGVIYISKNSCLFHKCPNNWKVHWLWTASWLGNLMWY